MEPNVKTRIKDTIEGPLTGNKRGVVHRHREKKPHYLEQNE